MYWSDAAGVKAEKRTFCVPVAQQELVEYYQLHSLKESFKLLDTTLRYPYKSRERSLTRANTRSPGKAGGFFSPSDFRGVQTPQTTQSASRRKSRYTLEQWTAENRQLMNDSQGCLLDTGMFALPL